jgi:hypothetical protein
MEILLIGLLIIFVPLIMLAIGSSLLVKSAETISETRKHSKEVKVEQFANDFYKKNGVGASWESYIHSFEQQFGRKPQFKEIKVPRGRSADVGQLVEVCQRHGIY